MQKLSIILAGTALGSYSQGAELGPQAMLDAGLLKLLRSSFDVSVVSEIPMAVSFHQPPDNHQAENSQQQLITWLQKLRQSIQTIASDSRVILLGGDHSVGAASLLATASRIAQPAIIYVDAHPDCHRLETSSTGRLHGMPVTIATGETLVEYFPGPYLAPQAICFVGIKDIDPAEQRWLDANQVLYFTMDKVIELGISEITKQLNRWVAGRKLHVSFDIDSIDGLYAPGTGIPNSGGLTYREASYLCRHLSLLHPDVVDLVEVNPTRDIDNRTVNLGVELAAALFGIDWDDYARYLDQHHG